MRRSGDEAASKMATAAAAAAELLLSLFLLFSHLVATHTNM